MEKKALLICNGKLYLKNFLRKIAGDYSIIACADGGANIALASGITPDFIIGDMDSIKPEVEKYFKRKNVKFVKNPDQESTDVEKAVEFLINIGVKKIDILTDQAGRFDHAVGNLSVLWNYGDRAEIKIINKNGEIIFVSSGCELDVTPGDIISILPVCGSAFVKTEGLKYELKGETLRFSGRGVSNVALSNKIKIEVKEGVVFVFRTFKRRFA